MNSSSCCLPYRETASGVVSTPGEETRDVPNIPRGGNYRDVPNTPGEETIGMFLTLQGRKL
jgi:hypothetical protein